MTLHLLMLLAACAPKTASESSAEPGHAAHQPSVRESSTPAVPTQHWLVRGSLTVQASGHSATATMTAGGLRVSPSGELVGQGELVLGSWRSETGPLATALQGDVWDSNSQVYLHVDVASESASELLATIDGPDGPVVPTLAEPTNIQRRAFELLGATIPLTLTSGE